MSTGVRTHATHLPVARIPLLYRWILHFLRPNLQYRLQLNLNSQLTSESALRIHLPRYEKQKIVSNDPNPTCPVFPLQIGLQFHP